MLASALLVFREVLEAALIITIVMAATRGLAKRGYWVAGGVVGGILGALAVALFAEKIAQTASGMGQEIFNACVLLAAVFMLAWHAIWMAKHGRELSVRMKTLGSGVSAGERPPSALLAVVALAVLREGSEIVLFMFGLGAGGSAIAQMLMGSALGLLLGVATGALLYFGLLRVPIRHFFAVTNWAIVLLAAGMASQAAGYLIQADAIPALTERVWDTSAILSNQSLLGETLKTLVGYDARPAGTQVVFYFSTAILIVLGMKLFGGASRGGITSGKPQKIAAGSAH